MSNSANSANTTVQSATQASQSPVVEFEYPNSDTGKMQLRYLRVTSADSDHIKGYELDNPTSKKDGQFKCFSRNRLVRQAPTLLTF